MCQFLSIFSSGPYENVSYCNRVLAATVPGLAIAAKPHPGQMRSHDRKWVGRLTGVMERSQRLEISEAPVPTCDIDPELLPYIARLERGWE